MKNLVMLLILFISTKGICQVANTFDSQLSSYSSFVSKPIHLPKWTTDVNIDHSTNKNYLIFNYNSKNFYLDSNNVAWAGNWFSWSNGGICYRWKSEGKKFADKDELNKVFWEKIKSMSKDAIAQLSPIEKYDIYSCQKGLEFFWASNQELIARGPYKLPARDVNGNEIPCGYCGFCNGARASGALMPEPIKEIVVKAKYHPEIEVTFYPTDLKALAAASYYYLDPANTLNVGLNYNDSLSATENLKYNPNPAVVDIILRQYLSEYKIPLFIDVQYNSEIWNETILGFDRKIVSTENVIPGTFPNQNIKQIISVDCSLFCQDEVSISSINGSTKQIMSNKVKALGLGWVKERKYTYKLLIDDNGNIIDGSWLGTPIDFIWLGTGEGKDSAHTYNANDLSTSNYTGNRNIVFNDILELFNLASK